MAIGTDLRSGISSSDRDFLLPSLPGTSFKEYKTTKVFEEFATSAIEPSSLKRVSAPLDVNALREIAQAQFKLGEMYYKGEAVERDFRVARGFFQKAAAQGNASAQYRLGWMAFFGIDRKPDHTEALVWNKKAADQGHAGSQFLLGKQYCEGKGVETNDPIGRSWLEKAAAQGCASAQDALGQIYFTGGIGLERNYEQARKWYELAAAQGHSASQLALARMYYKGLGVEKNTNISHQWLTKAKVNENNDSLQLKIADWYNSDAMKKYPEALALYEKLAAKGNLEAYQKIKMMYSHGRGLGGHTPKTRGLLTLWKKKHLAAIEIANQASLGSSQLDKGNYQAALKTLEKAASKDSSFSLYNWDLIGRIQGSASAQQTLGKMFLQGLGVKKNLKTARDWFTKASAQGHGGAQYDLAVMNEQGLGGEKNYAVALQLYEKVASSGTVFSTDAMFKIGRMYEQGLGVERSDTEALKWFQKAANEGDTYAAEALERLSPERASKGSEEQPKPSTVTELSLFKDSNETQSQNPNASDPKAFLDAQEKAFTNRLLSLDVFLNEGQKTLAMQRKEHASLQAKIEHANGADALQLKDKEKVLHEVIKQKELEQLANEERRKISEDDSLLGYYYAFQNYLNGVFSACQNLNSRMGEKAKSTPATKGIDSAADAVQFVKDEVVDSIPILGGMLKKVLQILSLPLTVYANVERAKAVEYMAHFFRGPIQCDQCAEGLARNFAIAQQEQIRNISHNQPRGFFKGLVHKVKDLKASRFDQNIPPELRDFAEKQCQMVIVAIMKNQIKPHPDPQQTLTNLAHVIMGSNFNPSVVSEMPDAVLTSKTQVPQTSRPQPEADNMLLSRLEKETLQLKATVQRLESSMPVSRTTTVSGNGLFTLALEMPEAHGSVGELLELRQQVQQVSGRLLKVENTVEIIDEDRRLAGKTDVKESEKESNLLRAKLFA